MGRGYDWWGFSSGGEYGQFLAKTPQLFAKRAFRLHDMGAQQETMQEDGGPELKKVLNGFHVAALGVGMIVGAGIFVSTGDAAQNLAGPAVVISMAMAGLSALLSSLCYSEFAVLMPYSGGAFNYLMASLGEYVAWLMVATLILEYATANAAVARSLAPYAGQLFGVGSNFGTFEWNGYTVDFVAAGLVLVVGIMLCFSQGGSSWFNVVVTGAQMVVILVILIAGFTRASTSNLNPFFPYGWRGIFDGASFVFFSFIGFDCVSTLAEETINPRRDMPTGIIGCIVFVTCIYVVMALCLVMMVPYMEIDASASFAAAFSYVGYNWGTYLVGLGACLGIITGVLVGCMGVSRIIASTGRQRMLPPVVGLIHPRWQTPVVATVIQMIATIPMAILTDLPALINLVSAGTLAVFAVVAVALLVRRYNDHSAPIAKRMPAFILIALIVASGVVLGALYMTVDGWWPIVLGFGCCLLFAGALHFGCKQAYVPEYQCPAFPYVPAISIVFNGFLMSSLPGSSYLQYLIFLAAVTAIYLFYSLQAQSNAEKRRADIKASRGDLANMGSKYSEADIGVRAVELP